LCRRIKGTMSLTKGDAMEKWILVISVLILAVGLFFSARELAGHRRYERDDLFVFDTSTGTLYVTDSEMKDDWTPARYRLVACGPIDSVCEHRRRIANQRGY